MQWLVRRIEDTPAHRPKRYRSHLADEYADLGDLAVALELRRHLRGGMAALLEYRR